MDDEGQDYLKLRQITAWKADSRGFQEGPMEVPQEVRKAFALSRTALTKDKYKDCHVEYP